MIRVKRPREAPAVLRKKGAAARRAHATAFAAGERTFSFDNNIYGHASVKEELVEAQHAKCCFCESKVRHIASGHIEHFRPKGGVKQSTNAKLETPGYFWLAYEWTNLLFSCEICNSRGKKNLFPLANPEARARKPGDDLAREEPLFLDPARDDPAEHIGFREEYPFAVGGSPRGEATWRALQLDREELAEVRRDHLQRMKFIRAVRDGEIPASAEHRQKAATLLEHASGPRAEWSSMVRYALRDS